MNKRIGQIAISSGIYDCILDPYDQLKDGDPQSSVMVDLERFAELIIEECTRIALSHAVSSVKPYSPFDTVRVINERFGIEEKHT